MGKQTSWKKQGADRRDERAVKVVDQPTPAAKKKKDTRRWCRGKVGVEHKPECRSYQDTKRAFQYQDTAKPDGGRMKLGSKWKILICTVCGKELDRYYAFADEKKNPPDWVVEK